VVDAVDTVTAKLEIIMRAKEAGVPVISCMGAGNKLDPTQFHVLFPLVLYLMHSGYHGTDACAEKACRK
jgi:hypothetical protein